MRTIRERMGRRLDRRRRAAVLIATALAATACAATPADDGAATPVAPTECAGAYCDADPVVAADGKTDPTAEPIATADPASPTLPPVPLPTPTPLTWRDCGDLECATLTVPLDRSAPERGTVDIAVARHRASGDRIGSLLLNPGGPGGSGVAAVDLIAGRAPELAERFDIVGWDPRGVGGSRPLECDEPILAVYELDASPDDAEEAAALEAAARTAGERCAEADAELLPHIGTDAVVDDVEALRVALGEDQISYVGFSYGTSIGIVYAQRHPERLRALVLDGVFDPTGDLETWLTSQAIAFEAAIDAMLGDDRDAMAATLDAAEAGTIGATSQDVVVAALAATYRPSRQDDFRSALAAAGSGDGSGLRRLADSYTGSAAFDAYTAVVCADRGRPQGFADYAAMAARITAAAPRVGPTVANELLPCAVWPTEPDPPTGTDDVPAPVLVLGNTGDAATPYAAAVELVADLDTATLVTYEGDGHLSFLQGNECVDEIVIEYLVSAARPEGAPSCAGG